MPLGGVGVLPPLFSQPVMAVLQRRFCGDALFAVTWLPCQSSSGPEEMQILPYLEVWSAMAPRCAFLVVSGFSVTRSVSAGGMECLHNFGRTMISEHQLQDNFYAVDLGRLYRLHQVRFVDCPRWSSYNAPPVQHIAGCRHLSQPCHECGLTMLSSATRTTLWSGY